MIDINDVDTFDLFDLLEGEVGTWVDTDSVLKEEMDIFSGGVQYNAFDDF